MSRLKSRIGIHWRKNGYRTRISGTGESSQTEKGARITRGREKRGVDRLARCQEISRSGKSESKPTAQTRGRVCARVGERYVPVIK